MSRGTPVAGDDVGRLGGVEHLARANALLSTLYDLVRSTPTPLSVDEVLGAIRRQLDEVFDADLVALLVRERAGDAWRVVVAEGVHLPTVIHADGLPVPLRGSEPGPRPVLADELSPGDGLWAEARSGAYLWLWSRGQPVALLLLEHAEPHATDPARGDLLERIGMPLGLAVDNAVWFRRLRTIGAEEERQRIGAELHDRFAQSLAYVAMELDRTVASHPDDPQLVGLRDDVRATLRDLRMTLRELRTHVTEHRGLSETLADHLGRVEERSGVVARLVVDDAAPRVSLPVEQQLLRIAQDLVTLAVRESAATLVTVRLTAGPGRLELAIEDDGSGLAERELGAEGRGILEVVRERADALGAGVTVDAAPGRGRTVAVTVRGLL